MKLSKQILKRLASASLWSLLGSVVSRLAMFVLLLVAARLLGRYDFGVVGLLISTAGTISLFSGLALGITSTRFIAAGRASNEPVELDYLRIILLIGGSFIIGVTALLLIFADALGQILFASNEYKNAVIVGVILSASLGLFDLFRGLLAGFERFNSIATMTIAGGAISLITVLVAGKQFGIEGILCSLILGNTVAIIWGGKCVLSLTNEASDFWRSPINWRSTGKLARFAAPMYLSGLIATPAIWWTSLFLTKQPNGIEELGGYNAAYQFHGPLVFLPIILMSSSVPVLVQLWEDSRLGEFLKVTAYISLGVVAFSLLPAIILATFSTEFISWFGSEFENITLVLIVLVIAAPVHGVSKILTSAILASNFPLFEMLSNAVFSITLLTLVYILIPKYLALGFALSFLIAHLVSVLVKAGVVTVAVLRRYQVKSHLGGSAEV